ncbi:MAG: hypothetical protein LBE85_12945 [Candidatus Accumulibacter sp.]|nr:hypothetical protein [Accumulibacter sp.]
MKPQRPSLPRQQCFIDGKWVDAADDRNLTVTNPAIGAVPKVSTGSQRSA